MLTQLKKTFSTIGVKLFLCFWLIAICSIALTRYVSTQLEQESIILPAHPNDLRKLKHLTKRITAKPPRSVKSLLKHIPSFRGAGILLKNKTTNKVHSNKKRFIRNVIPYLEKNSFNHIASIQFPYVRITGPETVEVNHVSYQLYYASKGKSPHISALVMQLPFWVKIIIPLLISMSISWLLARSLSKPLLKIKDTAKSFGNGDFTARVERINNRGDELGTLAKSFNVMAEKLEQGINAHQRLLADVSHELRSPMTRLQIALALANKSSENPTELEKHLLRCELEVTRLDEMIADVLTLSRLENTYQQALLTDIDLHELLETIIDDAQYLANEKSINIEQQLSQPCCLPADNQLLASAIQNILTNAIKYSPENTTINVNLQQTVDRIKITIIDAGKGVPEHALPELFKPFYRVSDSRERTTGGTGLGLAIAQQAILTHKGTINAKNNHSGGLTITINLPLNPTAL